MSDEKFYQNFWQSNDGKHSLEAKSRRKIILHHLKKKKGKKEVLLEIGVGDGSLMKELIRKFENVTAIDLISEKLFREKSMIQNKINFISKNYFDVLISQKFDIIICSEVIEHIEKEKQFFFLEKIYNDLAENGIVLLTTPLSPFSLDLNGPRQLVEEHLTEHELIHLSKKNNFDIILHKKFYSLKTIDNVFYYICRKLRLLRLIYIPFFSYFYIWFCKGKCKYQFILLIKKIDE